VAEKSRPSVPDLIRRLGSEDAFERRDAEQELVRRTRQDLGYRWNASEDERTEAIARWQAWWKSRSKGGKGKKKPRAMSLQGALLGLDQLKDALKGIPPDQLEAHLTQILEKMQEAEARRHTCESCGEARATVHITERDEDGELVERNYCEDCFRK
jgi:hypothetical protein